MKKLSKTFKVFIVFIIGILLVSGVGVYATTTYIASQIEYKNGKNVEQALNELYTRTENIDNYDNKTYIQDGLTIYDNRVTITNGGYYIDDNGVTWVNMTIKANKKLEGNDNWLLIYNLPTISNSFIITDIENKYAFYVRNSDAGSGNYSNGIQYFDHTDVGEMENNTVITLRFKY